jgi:2-amino-4-hydroxy-6-hydroxymethyldihydropteridine diphosphokinase
MYSGECNNKSVLLSLGSNLGDRIDKLLTALDLIKNSGMINDIRISSIYESEPVGYIDQPWFLNLSLIGMTQITANQLLHFVKTVEYLNGRKLRNRWHEREIDVDIIFFGSEVINSNKLIIPHPEFTQRKFVLIPSKEIAGNFVHPISGKTIETILNECTDNSIVKFYQNKIN